MKKLASKAWSWTLYDHDDTLYLSVLAGGAGMFEVNITLSADEQAAWEAQGEPGLAPLIAKMQLSPRDFKDRRVKLPPLDA